ncbi:MAG: ROK family protein [Oscillospiraceae bacterium]|nr:ROK family protein [Oscillospiraceae bacterium]
MEYLGIKYEVKNMPQLDDDFIPLGKWMDAFLSTANYPVKIGIERQGKNTDRETKIHGTDDMFEADYRYLERYIKFLLWSIGGYRIYLSGTERIAERLKQEYVYDETDPSQNGKRWFDVQFMEDVFDKTIEIVLVSYEQFPEEVDSSVSIGGHFDGNRIGLDLGGSDLKVSLLKDGEEIFSEERIWHPKTQTDPQYHFDFISKVLREGEETLGHVDAIGISSAGVLLGNDLRLSSLFIKVPREDKEAWRQVHTVFDRVAQTIGDGTVPVIAANDGDISALTGALNYDKNNVLGLAFGTSIAGGFVNEEGNILGWFNELAFAPVDLNEAAAMDEWSVDIGVACKYLSQDGVIKLAPRAGIYFKDGLTPAEKLVVVQELVKEGADSARKVFESIGCYLAHIIPLYRMFYHFDNLMLLGRVLSGEGGEIILNECKRILREEYPDISSEVNLILPDEKMRKVGQAYAAASLPEIH